ncbi:TlpA family protein disulfide reductase [Advenella sp. WQ 585]|uniref:TlpA family protein disulfide reductase n=1 Tax=Advenella mandrilli TaxID=2800330 RepID=A0ABS1EG95_9BURK|nr:TlpA disulfide reductase family protein [Advenella mandrilli]MBK1781705.1 TlpA family protein disulfide reductase [Advenella mandrilli]
MISVGPIPVYVILLAICLLLAWGVARILVVRSGTQSKAAGGLLLDAAFWGFVAARLAYLIQWREEYAQAPMSIIVIGDGGYLWWAGLLAAILYVFWKTRHTHCLRLPVLSGMVVGVLIWFSASHALLVMQRSTTALPDVQLSNLGHEPVSLSSYTGKPIVLNLWASWCPPCRREMPAFEQVAAQFPDTVFLMVNQGESRASIQQFLAAENLDLQHVLLDPSSSTMREVRARGLPTTLFFDAQGQLRDVHMGEITMAALKSKLSKHFAQVANDVSKQE